MLSLAVDPPLAFAATSLLRAVYVCTDISGDSDASTKSMDFNALAAQSPAAVDDAGGPNVDESDDDAYHEGRAAAASLSLVSSPVQTQRLMAGGAAFSSGSSESTDDVAGEQGFEWAWV